MAVPRAYDTLPHEHAIRLLRIDSAEEGAPLVCSLETYISVKDAPAYQALSYVWGDPKCRRYVELNGVKKAVTVNLYDALLRLRPRGEGTQRHRDDSQLLRGGVDTEKTSDRTGYRDASDYGISDGLVWVDALSINQDDREERAQQVSIMGSIYRHAKSVIIWLGKEDEYIPLAMDLITTVEEIYKGLRTRLYRDSPTNLHIDHKAQRDPSSISTKDWSPAQTLFSNPWFTRVWVYQECRLAATRHIHAGRYEITMPSPAIEAIYELGVVDRLTKRGRVGLWGARIMFRRAMESLSFGALCTRAARFLATDPRDKVYAMLPMSILGQDSAIPTAVFPDYCKSSFAVHRDAMRFCMARERTLSYLYLSESGWGQHKPSSWVWDLAVEYLDDRHLEGYRREWEHPMDGCSILSEETGSDPDILPVRGYHVATVGDVIYSSVEMDSAASSSLSLAFRSWLMLLKDGAHLSPSDDEYTHLFTVLFEICRVELDHAWMGRKRTHEDRVAELKTHWKSGMPLEVQPGLPAAVFHDLRVVATAAYGRRIFRTQAGKLGLGPAQLAVGDMMVVLYGGPVLYALRTEEDHYRFIGECAIESSVPRELAEQARDAGQAPSIFNLR